MGTVRLRRALRLDGRGGGDWARGVVYFVADCAGGVSRIRSRGMISTRRRLEYASGYLGLGLLKDAAEELALIRDDESRSVEALQLWVQLHHQAKQWEPLVKVAEALAGIGPKEEQGWISWAFALRELDRLEEAQEVLLRAEPIHGKTSAVLHYNLACYACLLGDLIETQRRLDTAFKLDAEFQVEALDDPDLEALRDHNGNVG